MLSIHHIMFGYAALQAVALVLWMLGIISDVLTVMAPLHVLIAYIIVRFLVWYAKDLHMAFRYKKELRERRKQ